MKISFAQTAEQADIIAFPVVKDTAYEQMTPDIYRQVMTHAAKSSGFKAAKGAIVESYVAHEDHVHRAAIVGVGDGKAEGDLQAAGGALLAKYQRSGVESLVVDFGQSPLDAAQVLQFVYGLKLKSWHIDQYRTTMPKSKQVSLNTVTIANAPDGVEDGWAKWSAIADGVAFTKELVSEPGNIIYPESFVERCQHLTELGVEITVLDEDDMAKLGMNALLGVGQGSDKPSRLLAMRWNGTGDDSETPLVLVGKGVTFDTGGISLKPGAGMEDMKWDMGGAGAVAGTMKALAGRKAKAHVIGVCGLAENMPDGKAQRPGDIVTSMSGQTIEVINTDAEGRLVLCDALHWAQTEYKPEYVINLATLTGAMIISLGHEHAGCFSNDDGLADKLLESAKKSGDALWRLPVGEAYDKLIDSPIADMKNVGPRGAGSITAAQFLKRFIHDGVKWAHLDIAGMVWMDKPGAVWNKGATGFGVRLLDKLVADHFEK